MSNDVGSTTEGLHEYASPTQLKYLQAIEEYGNAHKASQALGVHHSTVDRAMQRLKRNAAKRGHAPDHDMVHTTPEGFEISGVSTLYNPETGDPKLQWVKTRQSKEQLLKLALAEVEDVFSDHRFKVPEISAPQGKATKELLTVYPMGDPHIGMYSWAEETGVDFDLKVAETNLVDAMHRLVSCGPPSEQALIVNVGDFYHADNQQNRTMRSGNALDVDSRWAKVLHVGVRAMRTCIELALQKHGTVKVINEIGNHDEHTSQVLTLALSMAYESNPRVEFDLSPMRFHYYRFGKVLLGVTHGDRVKPEKLGGLMSTDKPQDWGETEHRYWYTGHVHNRRVFELPGCMVESFRTLAAKDEWTYTSGYRSGRDMYAVVLHKEFGEVERHRVDVAML